MQTIANNAQAQYNETFHETHKNRSLSMSDTEKKNRIATEHKQKLYYSVFRFGQWKFSIT